MNFWTTTGSLHVTVPSCLELLVFAERAVSETEMRETTNQ